MTTTETITVRYVLSAAIPVPGLIGGLREVDRHEFTATSRDLAAVELSDWARDTLRRHGGPLGLYLAECLLPGTGDWLSEEAICWNDDDELASGLRFPEPTPA